MHILFNQYFLCDIHSCSSMMLDFLLIFIVGILLNEYITIYLYILLLVES